METNLTISEGNQLFGLIGTTLNAMLKARKKELEPTGLSIAQTWALWSVVIMGRPTTVAEMSQVMDRDHQTTSQLLKRMERDGLVERRKGPHKASPIAVAITAKGFQGLQHALEMSRIVDGIVSCLSDGERDDLRRYLERLREKAIAEAALHSHLPTPFGVGSGVGGSKAGHVAEAAEGNR
jgi:DNA-binding MarR family transcriptional regulator